MKINLHTDYAFRVLLYLATHPTEKVTIAEIAAFFSISHEHLRKIIHTLSKSNYIKTYLGRNGGMELLKSPEDINLKQVFLIFEQEDIINCKDKNCTLSEYCTLSHIFDQAHVQFLQVLGEHTLAGLIHNKPMRQSLTLSKPLA